MTWYSGVPQIALHHYELDSPKDVKASGWLCTTAAVQKHVPAVCNVTCVHCLLHQNCYRVHNPLSLFEQEIVQMTGEGSEAGAQPLPCHRHSGHADVPRGCAEGIGAGVQDAGATHAAGARRDAHCIHVSKTAGFVPRHQQPTALDIIHALCSLSQPQPLPLAHLMPCRDASFDSIIHHGMCCLPHLLIAAGAPGE